MCRRFTDQEKQRIWDMHQAGVPVKRIAPIMGRQNVSLRVLISGSGPFRPRSCVVNERDLTLAEREEISRGLAAGLSLQGHRDRARSVTIHDLPGGDAKAAGGAIGPCGWCGRPQAGPSPQGGQARPMPAVAGQSGGHAGRQVVA